MTFQNVIGQEAGKGLNRLTKTVKKLEASTGFPILTTTATVSNPPTLSEINSAFANAADIGTDFIGLIVDTVNAHQWLVWTDGVNWYTINQSQQPIPSPFTVGSGVGASSINIDGGAGALRQLVLRSGGNFRWSVFAGSVAESGGNAGSNFFISRYDDAGAFLANALTIARDNGTVTIPGSFVTQTGITNTGLFTHVGQTVMPWTSLTLANGDNNNVALPANSTIVKATGPTAAHAITGINGGVDGRIIVLVSAVNFPLTIRNNSGSSALGTRIGTGTGADITVGNVGSVTFVFDNATGIWRVITARGSAGAF